MPLSVQWTFPLCVATNVSIPYLASPKAEAAMPLPAWREGGLHLFTCAIKPDRKFGSLLNRKDGKHV